MKQTENKMNIWNRLFSSSTYCSICENNNAGFNRLPDFFVENIENHGFQHLNDCEMTPVDTYSCKACGASDRERLYALWIKNEFIEKPLSVMRDAKAIHFAPEQFLSDFIQGKRIFKSYETADLNMQNVDYNVDLMQLPFENESFDFFICSHVLEHVPDDHIALKELYRITKKGGRGILMAPIATKLTSTIEGTESHDDADRWRLFGQHDHVRLYSHNDYIARIQRSGFSVQEYDASWFGKRLYKKLGLKPTSILYVALKT